MWARLRELLRRDREPYIACLSNPQIDERLKRAKGQHVQRGRQRGRRAA